jgi:hypothetical protein
MKNPNPRGIKPSYRAAKTQARLLRGDEQQKTVFKIRPKFMVNLQV